MKDKKKFLNRVVTWMCALVVVMLSLGSISFYASVPTSSERLLSVMSQLGIPSPSLPSNAENYKFLFVRDTGGYYRLYGVDSTVGNTPLYGAYYCSQYNIKYLSIVGQGFYNYLIYHDNFDYSGDIVGTTYSCSYNGSKWYDRFVTEWDTSKPYHGTVSVKSTDDIIYSDFDIYKGCYFSQCSTCGNAGDGSIYYDSPYDLPKIVDSYNGSLGYLTNVTSKKMIIDGDKQGTQTKYKFSFDTTSSSGVDLTSGDYVIKLYEQTAIYKGGIWQPFSCPRVPIGDFDASKGNLDFNIADAMTKTDTVTGDIEGYDFLSIALNNYVRADSYWLQIYNKTTGEYGGFVEMKNNPNLQGQFTVSTHHGNENDMSYSDGLDNGGYVGDTVDTNIGIGTDYENAELDADRGDLGDSGELIDQLDDIVSTVTTVPEIFRRLFSFLPDWCLNFFGISVGLSSLLILWKVGRG